MEFPNPHSLHEAYLSIYDIEEGKVPWHDPSKPLQSGWTPAEKNAAKRKRTGVEDPSKRPSDRDLERYGKMKSAHDNEEMKDRVKAERDKPKKGIAALFGKKKKEDSPEKPHQFKKVTIPDYMGGGTTTVGSQRRAKGTKEGDKQGYVSKTWNKGTGKAQSPIDPEDKRTRGRGSGPNPKKESFELYDTVLEYLLDEGFADTVEAAEGIMENMSDTWLEHILG